MASRWVSSAGRGRGAAWAWVWVWVWPWASVTRWALLARAQSRLHVVRWSAAVPWALVLPAAPTPALPAARRHPPHGARRLQCRPASTTANARLTGPSEPPRSRCVQAPRRRLPPCRCQGTRRPTRRTPTAPTAEPHACADRARADTDEGSAQRAVVDDLSPSTCDSVVAVCLDLGTRLRRLGHEVVPRRQQGKQRHKHEQADHTAAEEDDVLQRAA